MSIDWTRVARPQEDLYDTQVAFAMLGRPWPPPEIAARSNGVPRIFDGAVEVRPLEGPYREIEGFSGAPPDSPEIAMGAELVRRWPPVFRQFQLLMDVLYPLSTDGLGIAGRKVRGSASHSFESHFGTMCATVADPVGLAQALVHELGHTKLRALGVMVESARRLITNPPDELFESPIRKDKSRPMTAVLHAEYSFIYVTQLDLILLRDLEDEALAEHVFSLLGHNVPRVQEGFDTIRQNVRVDADGRRFVDSFLAWAEEVITEGERTLGRRAA